MLVKLWMRHGLRLQPLCIEKFETYLMLAISLRIFLGKIEELGI